MHRRRRDGPDRPPRPTAGLIASSETVNDVAEFGVVFLMFSIGPESSLQGLKAVRSLVFGAMLQAAVVLVVLIGAGQRIMRHLYDAVARQHSEERFVLFALWVVVDPCFAFCEVPAVGMLSSYAASCSGSGVRRRFFANRNVRRQPCNTARGLGAGKT